MIFNYSVIGKRIQTIRGQKHVTQLQLSSMAGISQGHLAHIENGSKCPSVEILIMIASSLGVSVDDLLVDLNLPKRESPEMSELLWDCSPEEQKFIRELVALMIPLLQKFNL